MNRPLLIIICLLCSLANHAQVNGQPSGAKAANTAKKTISHRQDFQLMEHSGILYQQFTYHANAAGMPTNTADTPTNTADTPADAPQKPALIIYLHGRSGSGKDNHKQIESPAVDSIVNYIRKKHMHAYLIAPQCPTTHEWVSSQRSPGYIDRVEQLIAYYLETGAVDPGRVYICGVSMGGQGTWYLVKNHPDIIAAAFIASARQFMVRPEDCTEVPLYVTVGGEERSAAALNSFTSGIRELQGNVQFEILPGLDHPRACDQAFSEKRLQWIFSQ